MPPSWWSRLLALLEKLLALLDSTLSSSVRTERLVTVMAVMALCVVAVLLANGT